MTITEAMKLALEALELEDMACRYEKDLTPEHIFKAITAIREALANYNPTSDHCMMENAQGELERIRLVQTGVGIGKPEQEPVAWMFTDAEGTEFFEQREDWEGKWTPLYTTPPQRKPLTDEEIENIQFATTGDNHTDRARNFARAIEAKLKEKNT